VSIENNAAFASSSVNMFVRQSEGRG
jgi:hypothetical protein